MWRMQIHHQIGQDILSLKRQGAAFTWKTLDALRARLVRAGEYECGNKTSIEERVKALSLETRPTLFGEDLMLVPLPEANMLLEWEDNGEKCGTLLTDRVTTLEMYVFRYSLDRERWRWPLIGMAYGPSFHDNCRIAVYEPTALQKCSANAMKAMVEQHVLASGTAVLALELARHELVQPINGRHETALALQEKKGEHQDLPTPSSLARACRTRHESAPMGKGAHRM